MFNSTLLAQLQDCRKQLKAANELAYLRFKTLEKWKQEIYRLRRALEAKQNNTTPR